MTDDDAAYIRHRVTLIACEGPYQCEVDANCTLSARRRRLGDSPDAWELEHEFPMVKIPKCSATNCSYSFTQQAHARCGPHHRGFLCASCDDGYAKVLSP